MITRRPLPFGVALLGAVLCAAAAQDPPAPQRPPLRAPPETAPRRASTLVGQEIVDERNSTLGTLRDVAADESGTLVAIVTRPGGDLAGVPLALLAPGADTEPPAPIQPEIHRFILKCSADKLLTAPYTNDIANIDAIWLTRVHEHYGDASGALASRAARSRQARPGRPICVHRLLGADVKNDAGDELGRLEDFAVTLSDSRIAYAVVSTGGPMHGVPWTSLRSDDSGKGIVLAMDKAALEQLPRVDLAHLPREAEMPVSLGPEPQPQRSRTSTAMSGQ